MKKINWKLQKLQIAELLKKILLDMCTVSPTKSTELA